MYIKKQRLLTPGPTPLYPKALYAMMGSDIHHRTQDFSNVYRAVLADLKEVFGTVNDVLPLVESAKLPRYYFNLKKERKNAASGETSWTPATLLVLALAEALKYIKQIGMANLVGRRRSGCGSLPHGDRCYPSACR